MLDQKPVQVSPLYQTGSDSCVRICSSGKAYVIWKKKASSWSHLNKSCSRTLSISCVCQKRSCTSKSGFMQQEHFCMYASWLQCLDNVVSGSSVNVLVVSLAAGITLISRYSPLVVWYVAPCFIDFVCTKLPYDHVLPWGISFGCSKGLVRKGGNSQGIRGLDRSETFFSPLKVSVSLTVIQFTFIWSYNLSSCFGSDFGFVSGFCVCVFWFDLGFCLLVCSLGFCFVFQ